MSVERPVPRQETSSATLSAEQVRSLARAAGFDEAGLVALPHSGASRDAARYET
jgi:hypothetical protein